MRAPTLTLLLFAAAVMILALASGCSSDTKVKHITGDVISRPSPDEGSGGNGGQGEEDSVEDVRFDSKEPAEAVVTKEREEILDSMQCDHDRIMLGFRSCYNTSDGKAVIYLRSSGYNDIPGLWFNIEVNDKSNYESTSKGLYGDGFVEYTLDLPEWKEKYGSTDRIIIIPLREKNGKEYMCHNRALLLEPKESCRRMISD